MCGEASTPQLPVPSSIRNLSAVKLFPKATNLHPEPLITIKPSPQGPGALSDHKPAKVETTSASNTGDAIDVRDNRRSIYVQKMSTFNSRSTLSSSASSRKYRLDENDTSEIMVYKVRHGTSISTQKDLCKDLDRDTNYRCSRKYIPRGCSRLDISQKDLYTEDEKEGYSAHMNFNAPIASVGLPLKVRVRRLFGQFQDLYIVSPEGSPASSPEGSGQNSQNVSPSNTFNVDEAQRE